MEVKLRLWLEHQDNKIFGKGPYELLQRVEELGSLRQAAMALDMSYTKAHRIITNLEASLGCSLLDKRIGGSSGGSSSLTAEAKTLMDKYRQLVERVNSYTAQAFDEIFR